MNDVNGNGRDWIKRGSTYKIPAHTFVGIGFERSSSIAA
jgi:hypothetical protein